MTDGGKFGAITGVLIVGSCLAFSCYFYVAEYLARADLPIEMRSPEMIQKHFDGEVILFSLTIANGALFLAAILFGVFVAIVGFYERRAVTQQMQ